MCVHCTCGGPPCEACTTARIAELEAALRQIKAICAGDRLPHWKEDMFTVTVTRGQIMDLCEIADRNAPMGGDVQKILQRHYGSGRNW